MEATKTSTNEGNPVRPILNHLFSPKNILKTEKLVNKRVCEKTLDLAEKYIKRDETVSSFNRNFMNEMVKADPEKFRNQIIQETGMTIGMETMVMYKKASRYFAESNEDGYKDDLDVIEKDVKKILDKVFRGGCTLVEIEEGREILKRLE